MKRKEKIQIVLFSILAVLLSIVTISIIVDVGQLTMLERLNLFVWLKII